MQRPQVDLAVKRRLKRVRVSIRVFYARYSANSLRASSLRELSRTKLSQVDSGVARTSPLLGHSMGTLRLYELQREVQKQEGLGVRIEILQLPRSVLKPYTVAKCLSHLR